MFSNVLQAIFKPVTESDAILISPNAGPSTYAGRGCLRNFFVTSYQNDQPHAVSGQFAQDSGYKRLFLLAPNYQAGRDAIAGVKSKFKGEIVGEEYVPLTQMDFQAELAKIAAAKPDAVFAFMPGGLGISLVKQYRAAGLANIPFLSTFTVDESVLPAEGDAAAGFYTGADWTPDLDNPANKKPSSRHFEAKFKYIPASYAAQAFDAALLIDAAVKQAGGTADKAKLIKPRWRLRASRRCAAAASRSARTTTPCRIFIWPRSRSGRTGNTRPRCARRCSPPTSTPMRASAR